MIEKRSVPLCKQHDHACCPCGYCENLYLVIDGRSQEVKKLFTCFLKAECYAKKHSLWLIQSIKLDDRAINRN